MVEKKTKTKITVPIFDVNGKELETLELNPKVFDGVISSGSIYRAVHHHRANARGGNASTKTRGEISGGGKKPWRQKGTGNARVGSIRSPLWRHGGIVFGPHPRDFGYSLPKKIKHLALRSALNDRAASKDVIVLDSFAVEKAKTKTFVDMLKKLNIINKVLFVANSLSETAQLSMRNIANVDYIDAKDVNAYDILSATKLLITKDALKTVTSRLL